MTTSCPISTIAYASDDQINYCFQQLVSVGVISSFAFIRHNFDNKKEHCHVLCIPAKRIILDDFAFIPSVEDPSVNALKPFRKSSFNDWFLYAIHDRWYCSAKGILNKHEYDISDFYFSTDDLKIEAQDALAWSFSVNRSPIDRMAEIYLSGGSVIDAMRELHVAFGAMGSFCRAWQELRLALEQTI